MSTVAFVTGTPSPFQVELGSALREEGIDYRIAFCDSLGDRGRHWAAFEASSWVSQWPGLGQHAAALRSLEAWAPGLVVCGGTHGPLFEACRSHARRSKIPLGVYAEQPSPRSWPGRLLRESIVGRSIRRDVAFILAIGDRARDTYARWLGRPQDVHQVAYYQDLGPVLFPERIFDASHTRFVFSGRLLERNRPLVLLRAFAEVLARARTDVSLCLAARGPEEAAVRRFLARHPGVAARVRFDTEFATWNDRVRPLREADVLVVPAHHSGWGLVVQEGLAAGTAVIATAGVESARLLVEHGRNGLLCPADVGPLAEAMLFLAHAPEVRLEMQRRAPLAVQQVGSRSGATRLAEIFRRYVHGVGP